MNQKVEITAEALAKMIADGVANALKAQKVEKKAKGKPGKPKQTDEQKAANRVKIEAETVANFENAGYKDVKPRINVMTYNRWIENGRRVKKNQKAIKCGSFPLFHIEQTEPIAQAGTVH